MPEYTLHGLHVRAHLPLAAGPATHPADVDVVPVDPTAVVVAAGELVADCRVDGSGYLLERDGAAWTLTFPGAATARWRTDGRVRVEVGAVPGTDDDLLAVLVGGPVVSAVALSLGHALLHASAVSWPDGRGAVGLVGPRGAGKSSIARLLCGEGRRLLSDDALRVDAATSGEAPRVHRGTTSSRLRTGLALGSDAVTRRSADGRVVVDDGGAPPVDRLAAVVLPLLSPAYDEPRVHEVPGPAAVLELIGSWPIDGVVDPGLLVARLAWAARIAPAVPVWTLEVPWTGSISTDLRTRLVEVVDGLLGVAAVS